MKRVILLAILLIGCRDEFSSQRGVCSSTKRAVECVECCGGTLQGRTFATTKAAAFSDPKEVGDVGVELTNAGVLSAISNDEMFAWVRENPHASLAPSKISELSRYPFESDEDATSYAIYVLDSAPHTVSYPWKSYWREKLRDKSLGAVTAGACACFASSRQAR